MTRIRRGVAWLLGAAALAAGCSGTAALRDDELPSAPLAIVYRDPETAARQAELLGRKQTRSRTGGIARVQDIAKLAGRTEGDLFRQTAGRLALLDLPTAKVTPLDVAPRGADAPRWSPDRTQLAFVHWNEGVPETRIWNRGSGTVDRVLLGDDPVVGAAPGPGGRIAAVRAQAAGGSASLRVWILAPGAPPRVASPGPTDTAPVWSPDGSLLVYVHRTREEGDTVAAIGFDDPEGTPPRTLARGAGPVFTPDGAWIVYAASTRNGPRLFKMRPDGSGKIRLGQDVNDQTSESQPAVSPDGRYVAYVAEQRSFDDKGTKKLLRIRRFDGSADREVLGDGEVSVPSW